jgi:hypothetical protein
MKRISSSSKLLTTSSFFFAIPGFYSYMYYGLYFPPLFLFTTSVVSANYWRDALDDWRRKLDIYLARMTFIYFLGASMYFVPPKLNVLYGIPSLTGILYCYHKSHDEYDKGKKHWKYWHFGFHTIVTCQLFLTLTYMGKNYLKLKNSK